MFHKPEGDRLRYLRDKKSSNWSRWFGLLWMVSTLISFACGGGGGSQGGSGVQQSLSITIYPGTDPTVRPGLTLSLQASRKNAEGAIEWRLDETGAGVVTPSSNDIAFYRPPARTGTFHVTAYLKSNPSIKGTFSVTVTTSGGIYGMADWTRAAFRGQSTDSTYGENIQPTATLLQDGKVLLVGGFRTYYDPPSEEVFDPGGNDNLGVYSRVDGTLAVNRSNHTATLLNDGRVLVVGGWSWSGQILSSVEIYDPSTRRFSAGGSLIQARASHTATLLPDGKILIAGGAATLRGGTTYFDATNTAEIYDPQANGGVGVSTMLSSRMGQARYLHTATVLPDGTTLLAGGSTEIFGTGSATADLFIPSTGEFKVAGTMGQARRNHAALLLANGKVLIVGGRTVWDGFSSAEYYTPGPTGGFSTAPAMTMGHRIPYMVQLANGKVLITDGDATNQIPAVRNSELFDPSANAGQGSFTTIAAPIHAHGAHTLTLLPNGWVLLAGGAGTDPDELFFP